MGDKGCQPYGCAIARTVSACVLAVGLLWLFALPAQSRDLVFTMARHPGIIETPERGTFVDLVKALDEVYAQGRIHIGIFPLARSFHNLVTGKADVHLPAFRNLIIPESDLPFRYSTARLGRVAFVFYTHVDFPLTLSRVRADEKSPDFPYTLEVGRGTADFFPFPVSEANSLEQSLKKLHNRRIQGCLWAQEEGDAFIRNSGMVNLRREFYQAFDDVFLIPKGPRGDAVDAILSDLVDRLRKTGRLEKLYRRIHKPYDPWQPCRQ